MWAYINENEKKIESVVLQKFFEIYVMSRVSGNADWIELLDLWRLPANAICNTCEFFHPPEKCGNLF